MTIHTLKILSIIIPVCFLSSCVDIDDTLGIDFVPVDQNLSVKIKEFNIPMYTAKMDSVVTSSVTLGAVGYVNNNATFGTFTAGSVFRMLPYNTGLVYKEGSQVDSTILTLVVTNRTTFGDVANVAQPLVLHRLTRDLQYNKEYYNNSLKAGDYQAEPISKPYLYKGEDTIKIQLTPEFAEELKNTPGNITSNDTLFLQKFKGYFLKADPSGTGAATCGQVSYLDFQSIYLTVNYHYAGEDTARYGNYAIEIATANFNVYEHGSSALANYAVPLPQVAKNVYVESIAGVKPYIDFGAVRDSIVHWVQQQEPDTSKLRSKLVINKADLLVDVDYPNQDSPLDQCPTSLMLAYKQDSTFTFLSDTYLDIFGGGLNRSLQQYHFNITYYTQGLFNHHVTGDTAKALYLYPAYVAQDAYGTVMTLFDDVHYSFGVLQGTDANGVPAVKLKLTYTLLK